MAQSWLLSSELEFSMEEKNLTAAYFLFFVVVILAMNMRAYIKFAYDDKNILKMK